MSGTSLKSKPLSTKPEHSKRKHSHKILKPIGFCCSPDNIDPLAQYDKLSSVRRASLESVIKESPTLKFRTECIDHVDLEQIKAARAKELAMKDYMRNALKRGRLSADDRRKLKFKKMMKERRKRIQERNGVAQNGKGKKGNEDYHGYDDDDDDQFDDLSEKWISKIQEGPIKWHLEDEIQAAKSTFWENRQKVYNDKQDRVSAIGKAKARASNEKHANLYPRWYQDFSLDQMKNLRLLQCVMQRDCEEKVTGRTQSSIIAIGIVSTFFKLPSDVIKKLLETTNCKVTDFLREIYKILTGNYFEDEGYKPFYDCNERIVLTAIAFLSLPEAIVELHERLPPVEVVEIPPKPVPPTVPIMEKKDSPYEEKLFERPDWAAYRNELQKWRILRRSLAIPQLILPPKDCIISSFNKGGNDFYEGDGKPTRSFVEGRSDGNPNRSLVEGRSDGNPNRSPVEGKPDGNPNRSLVEGRPTTNSSGQMNKRRPHFPETNPKDDKNPPGNPSALPVSPKKRDMKDSGSKSKQKNKGPSKTDKTPPPHDPSYLEELKEYINTTGEVLQRRSSKRLSIVTGEAENGEEKQKPVMRKFSGLNVPPLYENTLFDFTLNGISDKPGPVEYKICGVLQPPQPNKKTWLDVKDAHYIISGAADEPPTCPVTYEMTGVANVTPSNSNEKFFAVLKLGDGPNKIYPDGRKNLSRHWQEWLQNVDEEYRKVEREANKMIKAIEAITKLVFPDPTCDSCCSCRQTRKSYLKSKETKLPYFVVDTVIEDEHKKRYIVGSMAMHSPAPTPPESTVNLLDYIASEDVMKDNVVISGVTTETGDMQYFITGTQKEIIHMPRRVIERSPPRPPRNVPPCVCAIQQMFTKGLSPDMSHDNIPWTKDDGLCFGHKFRPHESPAYSCKMYPGDKSCRRSPFMNALVMMQKKKERAEREAAMKLDPRKDKPMFGIADFPPCGDEHGMGICGGPWGALHTLTPEELAELEKERKEILRGPPCGTRPGRAVCEGPFGERVPEKPPEVSIKEEILGEMDEELEEEEEEEVEEEEEAKPPPPPKKEKKRLRDDKCYMSPGAIESRMQKIVEKTVKKFVPDPTYPGYDDPWNIYRTAPTEKVSETDFKTLLKLSSPHPPATPALSRTTLVGEEGAVKSSEPVSQLSRKRSSKEAKKSASDHRKRSSKEARKSRSHQSASKRRSDLKAGKSTSKMSTKSSKMRVESKSKHDQKVDQKRGRSTSRDSKSHKKSRESSRDKSSKPESRDTTPGKSGRKSREVTPSKSGGRSREVTPSKHGGRSREVTPGRHGKTSRDKSPSKPKMLFEQGAEKKKENRGPTNPKPDKGTSQSSVVFRNASPQKPTAGRNLSGSPVRNHSSRREVSGSPGRKTSRGKELSSSPSKRSGDRKPSGSRAGGKSELRFRSASRENKLEKKGKEEKGSKTKSSGKEDYRKRGKRKSSGNLGKRGGRHHHRRRDTDDDSDSDTAYKNKIHELKTMLKSPELHPRDVQPAEIPELPPAKCCTEYEDTESEEETKVEEEARTDLPPKGPCGWKTESEQELPAKKTLAYLTEPDYPPDMVDVRPGGRPCRCREIRATKKILKYTLGGLIGSKRDEIDPKKKLIRKKKKEEEKKQVIEGVLYYTPPPSPRISDEYVPEYDLYENPYDMCQTQRKDRSLRFLEKHATPKITEGEPENRETCGCNEYVDTYGVVTTDEDEVKAALARELEATRERLVSAKPAKEQWSLALKDVGLLDYFSRCRDNMPCWLKCAKFNQVGCPIPFRKLKTKRPVCECKYERKILEHKEEKVKYKERQKRLKSLKKHPFVNVQDVSKPLVPNTKLMISNVKRIPRDDEYVDDIKYCITGVAENYSHLPPKQVVGGVQMATPVSTPEPSEEDIPCVCLHRHWSPMRELPVGPLPKPHELEAAERKRRQQAVIDAYRKIYAPVPVYHTHDDHGCTEPCGEQSETENGEHAEQEEVKTLHPHVSKSKLVGSSARDDAKTLHTKQSRSRITEKGKAGSAHDIGRALHTKHSRSKITEKGKTGSAHDVGRTLHTKHSRSKITEKGKAESAHDDGRTLHTTHSRSKVTDHQQKGTSSRTRISDHGKHQGPPSKTDLKKSTEDKADSPKVAKEKSKRKARKAKEKKRKSEHKTGDGVDEEVEDEENGEETDDDDDDDDVHDEFVGSYLMAIVKVELKKMAEEGYLFAQLPKCFLVPQLRYWLMYRKGFFLSETDKQHSVRNSLKMWDMLDALQHTASSINPPPIKMTKLQLRKLTFDSAPKMKREIAMKKEIFLSQVRKNRVMYSRTMWNAMEYGKFPSTSFKQAYFTYMASKESDGHVFKPWQTSDVKEMF